MRFTRYFLTRTSKCGISSAAALPNRYYNSLKKIPYFFVGKQHVRVWQAVGLVRLKMMVSDDDDELTHRNSLLLPTLKGSGDHTPSVAHASFLLLQKLHTSNPLNNFSGYIMQKPAIIYVNCNKQFKSTLVKACHICFPSYLRWYFHTGREPATQ